MEETELPLIQVRALLSGAVFTEYGRNGVIARRKVSCTADFERILWVNEQNGKLRYLLIADLRDVRPGLSAHNTKKLLKGIPIQVAQEKTSRCFHLVSNNRTLDLEADTAPLRDKWYKALSTLVNRQRVCTTPAAALSQVLRLENELRVSESSRFDLSHSIAELEMENDERAQEIGRLQQDLSFVEEDVVDLVMKEIVLKIELATQQEEIKYLEMCCDQLFAPGDSSSLRMSGVFDSIHRMSTTSGSWFMTPKAGDSTASQFLFGSVKDGQQHDGQQQHKEFHTLRERLQTLTRDLRMLKRNQTSLEAALEKAKATEEDLRTQLTSARAKQTDQEFSSLAGQEAFNRKLRELREELATVTTANKTAQSQMSQTHERFQQLKVQNYMLVDKERLLAGQLEKAQNDLEKSKQAVAISKRLDVQRRNEALTVAWQSVLQSLHVTDVTRISAVSIRWRRRSNTCLRDANFWRRTCRAGLSDVHRAKLWYQTCLLLYGDNGIPTAYDISPVMNGQESAHDSFEMISSAETNGDALHDKSVSVNTHSESVDATNQNQPPRDPNDPIVDPSISSVASPMSPLHVAGLSESLFTEIMMDAPRSFSTTDRNRGADGVGGVQAGLEDLLAVFLQKVVLFYPTVGYCQGMNFVGAFLLLRYKGDVDSALNLYHMLMKSPFNAGDLYRIGLPKLNTLFRQLSAFLDLYLPRLAEHFRNEMVDVGSFASPWLSTMFTSGMCSSFPFETVCRIWDAFLSEGWSVMIRVALAILRSTQDELLKMDLPSILSFLGNRLPPQYLRSKSLFRISATFPVTETSLTSLDSESDSNANQPSGSFVNST
eukprot:GILJ01010525.1.p1 GENE.GILJ01010525.1~~GILJ01010525.1.p1  ORF type:complete len:847 (-),score=154.07 GILJ01010525.1:77-2560(-)